MRLLPTLERKRSPLATPTAQRARLAALPLARSFADCLGAPLRTTSIEILQINVGKRCNQTCSHCHVDAGPDRREMMSREVMEACLAVLDRTRISTVDITGGAPELHPDFRWFVREVHARGRRVIDRCNLTILETRPMQDLPALFAELGVEVVCSLPHYRAPNTDAQRGEGVYAESIAALRRLNAVGYGAGDPRRRLVLVTNPAGAFLPASQPSLEREWKRELARLHGVSFDALFCITNMPISRYLDWLERTNNLERYMTTLVDAFNPAAVTGLMCRTTLSVAWDGTLYDCDFNQMLDMPVQGPRDIRDFDAAALATREVATDRHCFGCTAGAGSSCGGATT